MKYRPRQPGLQPPPTTDDGYVRYAAAPVVASMQRWMANLAYDEAVTWVGDVKSRDPQILINAMRLLHEYHGQPAAAAAAVIWSERRLRGMLNGNDQDVACVWSETLPYHGDDERAINNMPTIPLSYGSLPLCIKAADRVMLRQPTASARSISLNGRMSLVRVMTASAAHMRHAVSLADANRDLHAHLLPQQAFAIWSSALESPSTLIQASENSVYMEFIRGLIRQTEGDDHYHAAARCVEYIGNGRSMPLLSCEAMDILSPMLLRSVMDTATWDVAGMPTGMQQARERLLNTLAQCGNRPS